jgi:hypothetical protein
VNKREKDNILLIAMKKKRMKLSLMIVKEEELKLAKFANIWV